MNRLFAIYAAGALAALPMLSACSDGQDATNQQAQVAEAEAADAGSDEEGMAPAKQEPDYDRRYPAKRAEDTANLSADPDDYKAKYGETPFEQRGADTDLTAEPLAEDDLRKPDAPPLPSFAELDTNGDGLIDTEEGREHTVLTALFTRYDANDDGRLNKEEFAEVRDLVADPAQAIEQR